MFEHEDDPFGMGQENRTGVGQFDGLCITHEKDDAQFFFQGFDGTADGGLRNMQCSRCFAE